MRRQATVMYFLLLLSFADNGNASPVSSSDYYQVLLNELIEEQYFKVVFTDALMLEIISTVNLVLPYIGATKNRCLIQEEQLFTVCMADGLARSTCRHPDSYDAGQWCGIAEFMDLLKVEEGAFYQRSNTVPLVLQLIFPGPGNFLDWSGC